MILTHKGFVQIDGRRIKFIMASVFHDPCRADSNEWVYRLSDDDPRPLKWYRGVQWLHSWFAALPVGCWCHIVDVVRPNK